MNADRRPDSPAAGVSPAGSLTDAAPPPDSPAEAILAAARRLFAAHGFAGTSTRSIAEAAGVNLAMIHYYFGNKEQLYRQVVEQEFERLFAFVRGAAAQAASPAEFLSAMPGHVLVMLREHPELRQLLLREMVDGAPRLPAMVRAMGERGPLGLRRYLSDLVTEAAGGGLPHGIPTDHLLPIIFAVGHGLMAFAPLLTEVFGVDPRDPATAAALGRSAADVVRRVLAPSGEE